MEFSRQEYWSGLSFPTPGDLRDPEIELASLASPVLAGGFFSTVSLGKPHIYVLCIYIFSIHIIIYTRHWYVSGTRILL